MLIHYVRGMHMYITPVCIQNRYVSLDCCQHELDILFSPSSRPPSLKQGPSSTVSECPELGDCISRNCTLRAKPLRSLICSAQGIGINQGSVLVFVKEHYISIYYFLHFSGLEALGIARSGFIPAEAEWYIVIYSIFIWVFVYKRCEKCLVKSRWTLPTTPAPAALWLLRWPDAISWETSAGEVE